MNENKYICPFCGKEFKTQSGLNGHRKSCRQNPEAAKYIEECRKRQIKNWENPEFREKTTNRIRESRTVEFKTKQSQITINKWKDPEYREKTIGGMKVAWNDTFLRERHSQNLTKYFSDENNRKLLSEIIKNKWKDPEYREKFDIYHQSDEYKKLIDNLSSPEIKQKIYETKKQNNSFHTSKIENELKNYFDTNNIEYISQYKSDLYPFCCDFYFPGKDLYVEIQGSWTHGGKPYIESDPECIKQLELWKSKNSKYYNNAINAWTIRDVNKRNIAKQNNLNWIEIFSNDLNECLKIIFNN